jgi:hypothetical protein
MKTLKLAAAAVVCVLFVSHTAAAAPLTLKLQRTSVLYNEDPPGAPVPLGRTQYDAGNIMLNGEKIGEYLSVKDVHGNTLNVASLTITLFLPGRTDVPSVIKLEGVHSFNSGGQKGSISASDIPGIVGVGFTGSTATDTVTLLFP